MNNNKRYRALCDSGAKIPLYSQSWWLDAVCGKDKWGVVLVDEGEDIVGALPYFFIRPGEIGMPKFTQTMGPWIRDRGLTYTKMLSREIKITEQLINNLPCFEKFYQRFHPSVTNWLPFYWSGYKQTTRYTYQIPNIKNPAEVIAQFDHSKRKNIKRAKQTVEVRWDVPLGEFYDNHCMTLAAQGDKISYSREIFEKLAKASYSHDAGRTLGAYDKAGNLHSALFVVRDSDFSYDLISTIDPRFMSSGSASLLVSAAIEYMAQFVSVFDFEGSMIRNVETSFRRFGARQVSYFEVTKDNRALPRKAFRYLQRRVFR